MAPNPLAGRPRAGDAAAVLVRDATDDDAAAICELFNALLPTTTVAWRDHPTTESEQLAWLHERRALGRPTLVAEEGGEVVGYACWSSFRGGDRFPGYHLTVEHTIHVDGRHHGRGVGRRLLGALIERARDEGVHVMVAGVDADNDGSIRFHEAMGFVEVGRLPQTGAKFGRWLDLVLLQRVLDDAPVPPPS